jgi:ribosome-binding factor A
VTITDVDAGDLKSAPHLFLVPRGREARDRAAEALRRAAGYLRREVASAAIFATRRSCSSSPTSLERGARFEELLHQVHSPSDREEEEP